MTKVVYLIIALYLSLGTLPFHSIIAQLEHSETDLSTRVEQSTPTQPEVSPPRKATLSTDPEDVSRIVQIGGRVNLATTEIVNDIILVAGDAKIQGRVKGYIFVFGGNVEISQDAQVAGKVTVVLGEIIDKEDLRNKTKHGTDAYEEINGLKLATAAASLMMEGMPKEIWGDRQYVWFGWELMTFITLTFVHLLLVLIFPQQINNMASTIAHRPVGSTFLGLVVLIIVPYLSILLILSIAGIPFALLLCAILLPIAIYGKTAIFLSIGNTIFPQQSNIVAVIVGYWIYRMATVIPYLSIPTFIIASTIGIGISLRTVFGQKPIQLAKSQHREYSPPRFHR